MFSSSWLSLLNSSGAASSASGHFPAIMNGMATAEALEKLQEAFDETLEVRKITNAIADASGGSSATATTLCRCGMDIAKTLVDPSRVMQNLLFKTKEEVTGGEIREAMAAAAPSFQELSGFVVELQMLQKHFVVKKPRKTAAKE